MVAGLIGVDEERAGARALRLVAAPLNPQILDELARGPRRLVELRRETGAPPQTTLRARVRELSDVGAVAKRRLHPFPSVREHVLVNGAGRELRFVAATLAGWLTNAPRGGLELGGEDARAAVKALVDGWSAGILRTIAERPVGLADLEAAVEALSPPALERRLLALRDAGLVEAREGAGEPASYRVTDWLREAAAPLVVAIRWERKHLPGDTSPVRPADAEAGLLLAVPLLRLPAEVSGRCRLGVEFDEGGMRRLAGVTVEVEAGEVVACHPRLDSEPATSVSGPPSGWERVAIEANPDRLEQGGDTRLAHAVLDGLNRTLFPPRLI
ncbi:MAG TPA: winged helix-turn-helix transcriptional regulator [Solirubrobacterales bacterium]|nr:winged helix-turn-helix transcriptional regulator [Solirubrobacterales bacterium]